MAVRGVDHDEVDAGIDQGFAARIAGFANRGGGGDAQPALLVLAGIGMGHRLLDVFHRDETDAAIIGIDHQKLLDAMLMQEPFRLVLVDAFAHGDEPILGHQLGDFLPLVGGKAHIAVGENADQLARPLALLTVAAFNHRNAGNVILLHQGQGIGKRCLGIDGHRIDHHARFELLDLAHLRGLRIRFEIAVQDADPAGLRHGDRHSGLGDGVHGRGDDRNIELDARRDMRADIDVRWQNIGQSRLQQHVIEGICFARWIS